MPTATKHADNSFDSVIIFAGPGGRAFGPTQVYNLKTSLEGHGKTVAIVGNGERDLQKHDIVEAKSILLKQQASGKKCLFIIYTHGTLNDKSNQHELTFSKSIDYPSSQLISQLLEDYTGQPIDLFIFSCHGGALLDELTSMKKSLGYVVSLSPGEQVVSGFSVDAFVRKLMNVSERGIKLQLTQDLLILYLTTLSGRTPPRVLNQEKNLIKLCEFANVRGKKELAMLAEHFFEPALVEETINAINAGRSIIFKLYPCALFLNAITNGAILMDLSQNLLKLKTLPNQEVFFKRYLPEQKDSIEFSSTHQSQEKTIVLGAIPPENKTNTFSSFRPTEKTKRLFDATVNFTQALLSKKRDKNLILILTGTPGIGKTHLVMSALNEVRQKGMPTYYVTYNAFSSASYNEKKQLKEKIQYAPSLLVIDDCNQQSFDGDFTEFVTMLHKTSNTSILITSNESLGNIKSELPFGDNITLCEGNIDVTQRKPWWNEMSSTPISPAIMPSDRSCAMLLAQGIINLEKIKTDLLTERKASSLPSINIKIAGNPFDGRRYVMAEMGFKFKEKDSLDMIIIKVTNNDECDQLLNIVSSAWELNRKIIVVCLDEAVFHTLLESRLYFNSDKERIKARLDMMLLTPSILKKMPISSAPTITASTNKSASVIPVSIFKQPQSDISNVDSTDKEDYRPRIDSLD